MNKEDVKYLGCIMAHLEEAFDYIHEKPSLAYLSRIRALKSLHKAKTQIRYWQKNFKFGDFNCQFRDLDEWGDPK